MPLNKPSLKLSLLAASLFAITPIWAQAPASDNAPQPATSATNQTGADTAPHQRQFQLGLEVGAARYTSALTRNRFGDGFFIAPSFFRLSPASTQGTVQPDFDFTYAHRHDNRLLMGFLGAEYRRALTGDGSIHPPTQFHVGAHLGLVPVSIRSPLDGVNSGLKVGVGGGVSAGYLIKQRVDLTARYTAISRIDGFNLSNVRVGVNVKF